MMNIRISAVCFLAFFTVCGAASAKDLEWRELFDGAGLSGWSKVGGNAAFSVANGELLGTTVVSSQPTYLVTKTGYSDFILEYEFFADPFVQSSVVIRSNIVGDQFHPGYAVSIDPTQLAFSGGISAGQRGWLYPLSRNESARKALKVGQWNKFRIEAIGTSIRTWVNGQQAANLVDEKVAKGFIALQVPSVKAGDSAGRSLRWRNIRILTFDLESQRLEVSPNVTEISYLINKLTEQEKRQGWRLLWDGVTNEGWRGAKLDHFPQSGWKIADGVLTILKTDGAESTGPGDIVTEESFSNFELELEFKITEGANSGIKYFVDPALNKGQGSAIGCEFQILDDFKHPDAKKGVNGNRTVGSLYDLIPASNFSHPGREKPFNGVGEWNKARILSAEGKIEHWLNNEKVVEYDRDSQMFNALVAYSKYRDWPGFGQWPEGKILLQDHGDTVHFRSIKVREF